MKKKNEKKINNEKKNMWKHRKEGRVQWKLTNIGWEWNKVKKNKIRRKEKIKRRTICRCHVCKGDKF